MSESRSETEAEADAVGQLTGTVRYRERMALRPNAEVRVRLEDTSLADAPATVLASQTIATEGRQVPIPFELIFDAARIEPRRRYSVRAEIRGGDGELLFTTMTNHAVLTDGATTGEVDVLVERVASDGTAQPGPGGGAPGDAEGAGSAGAAGGGPAAGGTGSAALAGTAWVLDTYTATGGAPERFDEPESYTIEFAAGGNVSGQSHCNRFTGTYSASAAGRISFEPLAATLRACLTPSRERDYLDALGQATGYTMPGDTLRVDFGDGGALAFVRSGADTGAAARPTAQTFVFDCDGGVSFTVRTGPGEVALWTPDELGGEYLVLGQVRAASGARYEDGPTVFWDHGDEAMFEVGGQRYSGCRVNPAAAPWADARRRGATFRAIGNEPPWTLEIGPGNRVVLTRGYEQQRNVYASREPATVGIRTTYAATDDSGREVKADIDRRPCADSMSGQSFDAVTTVTVGGENLSGCGRFL